VFINPYMTGKDRKFYSQCCINMFFTVELICTSSICYDLDFDLRTMWRYNSFLLSGFMEMLFLLFVQGLGKMTLFNSLLFIFCFCLSSVMFFWLINLCILCFLCPVNHLSPTPLHFFFFCWYLIYSVFVRITLTFLGKHFLMILRNWLCSHEIKHSNLYVLGGLRLKIFELVLFEDWDFVKFIVFHAFWPIMEGLFHILVMLYGGKFNLF
jgi:hypothetical protein